MRGFTDCRKSNRIVPSWAELEAQHNPLTAGEKALVRYLDQNLPKDDNWNLNDGLEDYHGWLIFAQPFLNGTRPDVIVFNPFVGMVIFEVKDWDASCYRYDVEKKKLYVQTAAGGEYPVKRPQKQVAHYKDVILGQLVPMIGEAVDGNEKNFGLIKTAVYFHNATTERCRAVFGDGEEWPRLFGHDELVEGKLRNVVPEAYLSSSMFWDRKWSEEVLFWLRPPQHSIEQGTQLTLRGNQVKIAEPRSGHYRIRGVAGSGKTQMLAYRAAKLASQGWSVLILTFNITLWHYIRDMIARAPFAFSWGRITFDHFHGFCGNVLNSLGKEWPEGDGDEFFEETVPNAVREALAESGYHDRYDAILIDEGQDYVYNWYSLLNDEFLASRDELVVVCDKRQNIYERDLNWLDKRVTRRGLKKFGDYIDLTASIRQPPKLAAFSYAFAEATGLKSDVKQVLEPEDELISTEHIVWLELDEGMSIPETVYEQFQALKREKVSPSDVVVLVSSHQLGLEVLKRFNDAGVEVNHVFDEDGDFGKRNKKSFWMGDSRVKMCTIHSFKGWELQNVILVTPVGGEIGDASKTNVDSLVYTALTRVKKNIIVLNRNSRFSSFGRKYPAAWSPTASWGSKLIRSIGSIFGIANRDQPVVPTKKNLPLPREAKKVGPEYVKAKKLLQAATGNPQADFRDGQWEAIDGVLHNRRQLVVQRTGWGKSMIYFIASKFLREQGRGMTLLISPLLALMRNQVSAAERVGVRCYTINSTNPKEWDDIRERILSDSADLLIVSPERLANDAFREEILEPITDRIGLFVIDEAHCVSDWGHDFRPDYKKISRLLVNQPTVPVLATTATATERVIADIEAQLRGTVDISRGSLVRKSLYLQNIRLPSQEARLAWLAETLKTRIRGSGIVYALTIRDAEIVARWLRRNGIEAYAYSSNSLPPADLDPDLREELEDIPEWADAGGNSARTSIYRRFLEDLLLENRVRALVATSALSMGFDKSDLAFVIHYQRPKSVVDYYQQVGRAGRGIDSAYGVLLNGEEDDQIADYFIRSAFPSEEMVETVLDAVAAAPKGLSIVELAKAINIRQSKIEKVLRFVMAETPQPVVKDGSRYRATPTINSYRLPVKTIRRLTDIRRAECRQMDAYVKSSECLMQFLCEALESPMDDAACDRCANCRPDMRLPAAVGSALEQAAADLLRKSHVPIEPRSRWVDAESAIRRFEWVRNTVIPPELRMEEGRSLSLYGAGEWGRLVAHGKYQTRPPRFDDRLVEACAQMLREWVPEKRPRWIVPIPSRRNNALVGDFAERLARRLGMPCWRGLVKTMDTPPQKDMENSAFQQNNVIDAFAVEGAPPRGGCYLVDDMVDSRWTFTVAAAVLREAGVEFVVPLALADSLNEGE